MAKTLVISQPEKRWNVCLLISGKLINADSKCLVLSINEWMPTKKLILEILLSWIRSRNRIITIYVSSTVVRRLHPSEGRSSNQQSHRMT